MVFGLVLTPNKKYSQTVEKDYQVSNAALDIKTCGTGDTQLMVTVDKNSYILCTLNKKEPQYSFDLQIYEGEKIAFCSVGEGTIHLTGYMIPDDPTLKDFDGGSESDEEEEEEETEVPQLVPIEGKLSKKQQKKAAQASQEDSDDDDDDLDVTFGDEESDDDDEDDDDDDDEDEDDDDEEEDEDEDVPQPAKKSKLDMKENGLENGVPQKSKKELKKEKKQGAQQKQETQQKQKDVKEDKKPQQKAGKKQVLQGGVMIEDLTVGNGPEASQTKKVVVYYEGRLKSNNKVFDSCKKGNGFKFTIGRGEVIRGWDIGVAGMKVGSKRRITCPPNMAYGSKGSPPVIPPNSTLVFDVELRHVK